MARRLVGLQAIWKMNLKGRRFGFLKVLRKVALPGEASCWLCRCRCGREVPVLAEFLIRGEVGCCGHRFCGRKSLGQ